MPSADVQYLLKYLAMARSRFVHGLDCVPDERLNWSPGEGAKTPLQIADSCAGFFGFVGYALKNGAMPESREFPPASPDRESAKQRLGDAFDALADVVRNLTDEDLQRTMPVPWRTEVPVESFLYWVSSVAGYWQGQLNYLQTTYGDREPNVPKGWGTEEY
ncbi:MAG: DinB family protein [Armatimonadota bacterium]